MANNPKLFIKLTTMNRAFCPGYSLAEEVGRNRPNAQVTAIMPSIELFIGLHQLDSLLDYLLNCLFIRLLDSLLDGLLARC